MYIASWGFSWWARYWDLIAGRREVLILWDRYSEMIRLQDIISHGQRWHIHMRLYPLYLQASLEVFYAPTIGQRVLQLGGVMYLRVWWCRVHDMLGDHACLHTYMMSYTILCMVEARVLLSVVRCYRYGHGSTLLLCVHWLMDNGLSVDRTDLDIPMSLLSHSWEN